MNELRELVGVAAVVAIASVGCGGDDNGNTGAGTEDTGTTEDTGSTDAGTDTGTDGTTGGVVALCPDPLPGGWLFCDDFEQDNVADRYYVYDDKEGEFVRVGDEANSGSFSMETHFREGDIAGGALWVNFGRNPAGSQVRSEDNFDEIFWRMFVMHQPGWTGSPGALSQVRSMWDQNHSPAMFASLNSSGDVLAGGGGKCVDGDTPVCMGQNDPGNTDWINAPVGTTPIFSTEDSGTWRCVEGHVVLNTPGQSDGVFEFWIDDALEGGVNDLDWRGSYTEHEINSVFFFSWWDGGAPAEQRRWVDDFVIATERIGCDG